MKPDYQTLLKNAPDHMSHAFLKYLKQNNKVVLEDNFWLVIENAKYHTKTKAHHTAFLKRKMHAFIPTWHDQIYPGWQILIRPASRRTIKRWHVHFIEDVYEQ